MYAELGACMRSWVHVSALQIWAGNLGTRDHIGQEAHGPGTKPGIQKGAVRGLGRPMRPFWVPGLVTDPWVPWPIWTPAPGFLAHICKAEA